MLSISTVREILQSYRLAHSEPLCSAVSLYTDLLLTWNRRVSLTSVEDPEEIVRYHFAESFLGARVAGIADGRLADVGTGAGFPGLALKLYVPALKVTLIESNAKKCAFLGEAARMLGLVGLEIIRSRFEQLNLREEFNFVASRALGEIPELLSWATRALAPAGKVVLWLGPEGLEQALTKSDNWKWGSPQPIPRTKRRFIIVGARRCDQ